MDTLYLLYQLPHYLMNRILIYLIALISFSLSINAQSFQTNLKATLSEQIGPIAKGQSVVITNVGLRSLNWKDENEINDSIYLFDVNKLTKYNNGDALYCLTINDIIIPILDNKISKKIKFEPFNTQDFWDASIIENVLYNLQDKGIQNELREEAEADAIEYINKLNSYGLILNDPYLELYIYSIIAKLAPDYILGRPTNINIVISQDPSMNACIFPNGTLIINTGLIARIHNEDELAAILAHEISHFMLDHSIQNINKEITRKKRSEFWKGIATGITAVSEAYVASKNPYYIPGAATIAVAAASHSIAVQVNERLGMKYNQEQELEADKTALEVLRLAGYNTNALATVFKRIINVHKAEYSSAYYFDSYTHPALIKRVQRCGTPELNNIDNRFEKIVSVAVTNMAKMKFENRRFKQAIDFATQNIENGVATSDDYLIKANCLLALYNSKKSNSEVLALINKAKEIDPANINISKIEILTNLRLGDTNYAISQLKEYYSDLKNTLNNTGGNSFIAYEMTWANDMLCRLRGL